eukprot:Platyproteum_vivax@DN2903_c0_g1_i2.p1
MMEVFPPTPSGTMRCPRCNLQIQEKEFEDHKFAHTLEEVEGNVSQTTIRTTVPSRSMPPPRNHPRIAPTSGPQRRNMADGTHVAHHGAANVPQSSGSGARPAQRPVPVRPAPRVPGPGRPQLVPGPVPGRNNLVMIGPTPAVGGQKPPEVSIQPTNRQGPKPFDEEYEPNPYYVVECTDSRAVQLLPLAKYIKPSDPKTAKLPERCQCFVCFEDYIQGEVMRWLPCTHGFHRDCVDTWLARSVVCPICKADVRSAFMATLKAADNIPAAKAAASSERISKPSDGLAVHTK